MAGHRWFIGLKGLFILALGILFVTNPGSAAAGLAFYLGLILVVGGIVSGLYVWWFKRNTTGHSLNYIPPIISLAGGCLLLFFPTYVLSVFAITIGLWILIDGLSQIKLSSDVKNYNRNIGNGMVLMGILSLVIGILIIVRPYELIKIMTVFFGFIMLVAGAFHLLMAIRMK